ncbi:hypothetical protein PTKIN_Ptkin01aG0071400 [Pterospermum kingtungense]
MKALSLQKNQGWPKEIKQDTDSHQFAYYTLKEKMREFLQESPETKFVLTGHSLGGALAILFVSMLILHEDEWLLERLDGVYTFGQPRVGDEKFREFMKEKLRKYNVKYFRLQGTLAFENVEGNGISGSRIISSLPSRLCQFYPIGMLALGFSASRPNT